jgi:nucleoside triphosphatase
MQNKLDSKSGGKEQIPEVVTGAYILDPKDRLLLVKSYKWGDQWMIPGGHAELGEKVLECAKRESLEEVGLSVEPEGILVVAEDIFPESFHQKKHFIYFEVVCRASSTEVRPDGREIQQYGWFGLEEALLLAKEPVIKRTISTYLEQKKRGRIEYININK